VTLRIASVCKSLPNPGSAASGAFVMRRLAAMAERADVDIIQPLPYFPGIRRLPVWAQEPSHQVGRCAIRHAPMLYLPGVLKRMDGRWLERAVVRVLEPMHRAAPYDLIDAHFGYPDGVGSVRVAIRLGLPSFVTVRGLETDYLPDPEIGPQLAAALRRATGCISVSHSLKLLLTRHGVPDENIRVIPNSVDRALFRPGSREEARAKLGLPAQSRLIVSVGTLINLKRHHVVIGAMPEVRRCHPAAELVIIGTEREEREYPGRLHRLAGELGVTDAVRVIGAVAPDEVAKWLTAADAFCLVSAREGCCNAVLEALASGRPVVASPAGDNPHFVRDHRNGYVVPIDDVAATAEALVSTLRRTDWDAEKISRELSVGDWAGVADEVLGFFAERLAAAGSVEVQQSRAVR